jgi:hypothetical protein
MTIDNDEKKRSSGCAGASPGSVTQLTMVGAYRLKASGQQVSNWPNCVRRGIIDLAKSNPLSLSPSSSPSSSSRPGARSSCFSAPFVLDVMGSTPSASRLIGRNILPPPSRPGLLGLPKLGGGGLLLGINPSASGPPAHFTGLRSAAGRAGVLPMSANFQNCAGELMGMNLDGICAVLGGGRRGCCRCGAGVIIDEGPSS